MGSEAFIENSFLDSDTYLLLPLLPIESMSPPLDSVPSASSFALLTFPA